MQIRVQTYSSLKFSENADGSIKFCNEQHRSPSALCCLHKLKNAEPKMTIE